MKETRLWDKLRPPFQLLGKFYKTSDRFTEGVPDVLGVATIGRPVRRPVGFALELKEFDGKRILRVSFRPGQLDWLRDWQRAGGRSWIVVSDRTRVYVYQWERGKDLEAGISPEERDEWSELTRDETTPWPTFSRDLLELLPGPLL